jgi:hypothetical protein
LDFIPLAIVGLDGLKALADAPVLLTAEGMVSLKQGIDADSIEFDSIKCLILKSTTMSQYLLFLDEFSRKKAHQ